MDHEDALRLFESHSAIRNGHFLLSSGRHSDTYVQTARVMERPRIAMSLAEEIASWYADVEVLLAPAVGAIALGFAVALAADARSVFAEREAGSMRLRRGFVIDEGERAVVVDNVMTTGESAREVYELARQARAEVLGVAALVDRTEVDVGLPVRAILRVAATSWEPRDCPLCRRGASLDAPGSRHLQGAG